MYCYGCGKPIDASAFVCLTCGAPQKPAAGTLRAAPADTAVIPASVEGWSWGAFLLNGIWAIGNRTWIGLLAFIPVVGLAMSIVLGIKGRTWAWHSRRWESVEHFNAVQRKWSIAGFIFAGCIGVLGLLGGIGLAMYEDQQGPFAEQSFGNNDTSTGNDSGRDVEAVSVSEDGTITYSDGTSFNPGDVECKEGVCEDP